MFVIKKFLDQIIGDSLTEKIFHDLFFQKNQSAQKFFWNQYSI